MQLFRKIYFASLKTIYPLVFFSINQQQIWYHDPSNCFKEKRIPKQIEISKDQVTQHLRELMIMRKMEISCDSLYKQKLIRGFCHLYDGQEAIAQGIEAALTYDDPLITAYRSHCQAYKRGISIRQIIAEMLSKTTGASKGKGGSMHLYKKNNNFYGGNAIVGSQIPVGTGLAFALKYQQKRNCAVILFGDGAANQGQLYEAMNLAYLWKLPAVYVCENNGYAMGTSIERSSMNTLFYTRGDKIPGIRTMGNDVFSVRQVLKFAKQYAIKNGPICIQLDCYRYHGHSMSDPGTSYRTRKQISDYRNTKDCILKLKQFAMHNQLISMSQIEQIEKQEEEYVQEQIQDAKNDQDVQIDTIYDNVYAQNYKFLIRGKIYEQSHFPKQNY